MSRVNDISHSDQTFHCFSRKKHGPSWKLRSYFYHLNSTQARNTDRRGSFAVISIISTLHKQETRTIVEASQLFLSSQLYTSNVNKQSAYINYLTDCALKNIFVDDVRCLAMSPNKCKRALYGCFRPLPPSCPLAQCDPHVCCILGAWFDPTVESYFLKILFCFSRCSI